MPIPDMTLTSRHGFYELAPNTPAGKALVQEVAAARRSDIGTDFDNKVILLDAFFGFAGDWCRCNVLPRGLTLQWGGTAYAGERGQSELFEQCA